MKNWQNEPKRDRKITKQQDNKPVWKTVPSEARVTRDEVSGLINRKETSVWKTVPFPIGIFLLFLSIDIFFVHLCLEDSTFQHSEKESTDKNKAQKVMLCKKHSFYVAITMLLPPNNIAFTA